MHLTKLRPGKQITLPERVARAAGLRVGDIVRITAGRGRVVISAQAVRERGRTYRMADLVGAAPGLYASAAEVDEEINAGRDE